MLWPLVIIAVDVIICVIFCKRCRRHEDNTDGKIDKDKEAATAIETKPLTVAEEGVVKVACASGGGEGSGKGKSKKGKGKAKTKAKEKPETEKSDSDTQTKAKTKSLWI